MEKRAGYTRDTMPIGRLDPGGVETDEELKIRLGYVIGQTRELVTARGDQLDGIAERHGLRRRHGVFYRSDGFNYGTRLMVGSDPGQPPIEDTIARMAERLYAMPVKEFPDLKATAKKKAIERYNLDMTTWNLPK